MNKIRSLIIPPIGFAVYSVISYVNGNEKYYEKFLMPTIHLFDPELCHNFAVWMCKMGLVPNKSSGDPKCLETSLINFKMKNPIGIAAGFDKHGEAIESLDRMGFGFVEIGSVTPKPQSGNPVPRLFRVPEKLAVINRYGFNSKGHSFVADRVRKLRESGYSGVIGVNLGANKDSLAPVSDYMDGIAKFSRVADYIVINISSPNTPGLRNLQYRNEMTHIMSMVNDMQNNPDTQVPIFIKIAPDITQEMKKDIADIITNSTKNLGGLIICNTTVNRTPGLPSDSSMPGGVSGMPLKNVSTKLIAEMYLLTKGKIPIIGVGGIFTGRDAYDKICAGASAIQIYTSFIYFGPPRITQIKEELSSLLRFPLKSKELTKGPFTERKTVNRIARKRLRLFRHQINQLRQNRNALADHSYCLPSPRKLKKICDSLQERNDNLRKQVKHIKQGMSRNIKQFTTYEKLVAELYKKLQDSAADVLGSDKNNEILKKLVSLSAKGTVSDYPPDIKQFALTINFYSAQAYRYLRKYFELPHPRTLCKTSVNGSPGFTEKSLKKISN